MGALRYIIILPCPSTKTVSQWSYERQSRADVDTVEPMSHVIDVYIVGQQGWWEVSGECHPRKLYPGSESVLPGALVWPAQVKTGESSVAGQRPGSQDCVMRLTA